MWVPAVRGVHVYVHVGGRRTRRAHLEHKSNK